MDDDRRPRPATLPPAAQAFPEPDARTRISGRLGETMLAGHTQPPRPPLTQFGLPPAQPTVLAELAAPLAAPGARLVERGTLINNNYRIEEMISTGGMGEVYRAVNLFTGDPVAVKVILSELARDRDIIEMFRREARVLVQLRHEAIVSYHNFVLDQGLGRYCLIMEFVEGTHLGARLRDGVPMPDDDARRLLRRLAQGLARAHDCGVTHRDLSPDNVILRHDRVEEAVLIDFGIARSTELGDGLDGRFAGKYKYIAPEQLGDDPALIGPRTDIYGLALLMVAIIRGRAIEMGDSVATASAARRQIPPLDGVSHRLFPLLQHMLEPDPAARPADMGRVIQMLDDPMLIPARYRLPLWQSGAEASSAAKPLTVLRDAGEAVGESGEAPGAVETGTDAAPGPPASPGRGPFLLAASVVLIAAAGLGWMTLRPIPPPPAPPQVEAAPPDTAALPARDTRTRDGFLAELDLGPCALAQRVEAGPQAGTLALFSPAPIPPDRILDPFEAAFQTRPSIAAYRVSPAQCPVLDLVSQLAGRAATPPQLSAQAMATPDGFALDLSVPGPAARNLWLALIAPDGSVYDLTAQSSTDPQGVRTAQAAIDLPAEDADRGPWLLLALATEAPPLTLAAAPTAASAERLMPALLDEVMPAAQNAAAMLVPVQINAAVPEPTP